MRPTTAALLALTLSFAATVRAEDWPQFRGRNSTGVSTSTNLPIEFSADKARWSKDVGEGIACPIVVDGRVFVTGMSDDTRFSLHSFDLATGTKGWTTGWDTGPVPSIHRANSYASSTPAGDADGIYLYASTLGLLGVDRDGKKLWRVPLEQPEYILGWGTASSPIVHKDRVILARDDDLAPFLIAVDKKTGEILWRTDRSEMLGGYSVPIVYDVNDRTELAVAGTGKLKGYDPQTGKELWTCNSLLRLVMTTPVYHDGLLFTALSGHGDPGRVLKHALLQHRDRNGDGKMGKDEVAKSFWKKFDHGDVDKDGFLVDAEIDRAFQSPENMVGGGNVVQAVRVGGAGDVTATHVRWGNNDRSPSKMASPLVVSGRLFLVKRGGISSCYAIASGEKLWYQKRIDNVGEYYASPVSGDGKIYVTGENGVVVVLKDAPELEILAKNDLGEACHATPAIADGRLFFRTRTQLLCVAASE